jgi:hypothetical protein
VLRAQGAGDARVSHIEKLKSSRRGPPTAAFSGNALVSDGNSGGFDLHLRTGVANLGSHSMVFISRS